MMAARYVFITTLSVIVLLQHLYDGSRPAKEHRQQSLLGFSQRISDILCSIHNILRL